MIGAVNIHQPSLGLRDLQRVMQPSPFQQPAAQKSAAETQTQLQINDSTNFSTRQGRVPAAMVKLFDDAPQQATKQDSTFTGRLAEGATLKTELNKGAAGHNVTRTNMEHSKITHEQLVNPKAFAAEQGSQAGAYQATSHVLASQSAYQQERTAQAGSNKHQMAKAQQYQQYQKTYQQFRQVAPSKPAAEPQRTSLMQDMGRFIKDVVVPGSAAPAPAVRPLQHKPMTAGRLSITV